jgi:hypothetical protein
MLGWVRTIASVDSVAGIKITATPGIKLWYFNADLSNLLSSSGNTHHWQIFFE